MRRAGILLMSVVAFPLHAGPRPASPAQPAIGPEVQQFAQQLLSVAEQVREMYVRPIPLPDLIYASLAGMYETARMPVPVDLKARVTKAAAAGELILVVQQVHGLTVPTLSSQGRNPMVIACQGMTRALDPFSGMVSREEKGHNVALESDVQGVGLDLAEYGGGPLIVKAVYPGSSAQRAGLRPGDRITHVNGDPVEQANELTPDSERIRKLQQLLETISTDAASPTGKAESVALTVRRSVGSPRTVNLRNERFHVETVLGMTRDDGHRWHYWADPTRKIAYVRLGMLAHATPRELAEVLERMDANGMRGLVLDLRWTPGGWLNASVETARLFLGSEKVATVKSRGEEDKVFSADGPSKFADLPVVILVNAETSGGAELIAAALQDHKRAVLVGQRTRGKASVQTPLDVGSVPMKLTTGTFFPPSGKNLNRFPDSKLSDDWGVIPDIDARVSPELGRQLKEWWQWQTLRPGPSMERLPLDDPSADPQRNAAVDALAAILEKKM